MGPPFLFPNLLFAAESLYSGRRDLLWGRIFWWLVPLAILIVTWNTIASFGNAGLPYSVYVHLSAKHTQFMYIFLQSKILNLVLYNCAEINDSTSKDFDSIVCDEYRVVGLYAIFVYLFSAWYCIWLHRCWGKRHIYLELLLVAQIFKSLFYKSIFELQNLLLVLHKLSRDGKFWSVKITILTVSLERGIWKVKGLGLSPNLTRGTKYNCIFSPFLFSITFIFNLNSRQDSQFLSHRTSHSKWNVRAGFFFLN